MPYPNSFSDGTASVEQAASIGEPDVARQVPRGVWIAWETQRRSVTLSRKLGYPLHIFDYSHLGSIGSVWSAVRTAWLLVRARPGLVVVQNPSMVLATLACVLRGLLGFYLVVDRHSNFLLAHRRPWGATQRLFMALSRFTLRHADLTLVTNEEIAVRVMQANGRAFILPDPFPEFALTAPPPTRPVPEVVFVCSWAKDEPIAEMMEACRLLQGEVVLHVTGKPRGPHDDLLDRRPSNFRPTGYLPEEEYVRLLATSNAVVVLTTMPATLVCGAYEAVALGQPVLLSHSEALKAYFGRAAEYVESHDPPELARGVRRLLSRRDHLRENAVEFLATARPAWELRFAELCGRLRARSPSATRKQAPVLGTF